ncbi:MAG TPA: ribonuclease Z [Prolixibacteraceae bacterium]|nr:ribonuclease Z [Prolixibacteraceae bacterium]
MISFELTILGTSSALPTSTRYPTAHVLNVRERFFLIDCGEGTQIQMRKYGIKFHRINHIFISHLHGDHYYGLIGLLSSYTLLERKTDLHIYAHSDLPLILKSQLDLLSSDLTYKIIWHPLNFKREQIIFENAFLKVRSFPLRHRIPCCGFLFSEQTEPLNLIREKIRDYRIPVKDLHSLKQGADFITPEGVVIPNRELTHPRKKPRSYAFCTDTSFLPELRSVLRDVDLLYHEATYDKRMEKRAGEIYHSTASQAARLAKMTNAGQLIIGHFSARYKDVSILVDEAKEVFENTLAAEEGMVIPVPSRHPSQSPESGF